MMSVPFLMMVGSATPELVDAAADGLDALAERVVAHLLDLIGVEAEPHDAGGGVALDEVERACGSPAAPRRRAWPVGRLLEGEDDVVAPFAADGQVGDALVLAEPVLDVRRQAVDLVRDRLVDVDLVDEVQTALKVETQLDPLLEVLLEECRLLLLRHHCRHQVERRPTR